jgi:GNAT superfamily N-acetyltransferase
MGTTTFGFTIHTDKNIHPEELGHLLSAVGWDNGGDLEHSMDNATFVAHVRDAEGKLAGYISVLSDGVFTAFVDLILVRPDLQRLGIGKALLQAAETQFRGVPFYAMPFTDAATLFLKSGYSNKLEKPRTMLPVSKRNVV